MITYYDGTVLLWQSISSHTHHSTLLLHCTPTSICRQTTLLLQASKNKLISDNPLFTCQSKPWYPPFSASVCIYMKMLLIDLLRCWGWQGEILGFEEDRSAQLAAECPLSWGHPPGPSTGPHPYPTRQKQGNETVTYCFVTVVFHTVSATLQKHYR